MVTIEHEWKTICELLIGGMAKHYISPVGPVIRLTGSLSAIFKKNCPPHGSVRVGTQPRGSDRVRSTGFPK